MVPAEMADADHREPKRRQPRRSSAIGRPTMAIEASLADLNTCSPSRTSVRPASIDSAEAPATRMAWMVARPITGTSNRMSWFGLGHLDDAHAGAGEVAGAADDLVGAFHRLDGDDRLVLDGDRLADVERGNRIGHPVAELEVGALLLVGRTLAQHPRPGEQRREKHGRVQQFDPFVAHHVGDRGDQGVGVARLEAGEHGRAA